MTPPRVAQALPLNKISLELQARTVLCTFAVNIKRLGAFVRSCARNKRTRSRARTAEDEVSGAQDPIDLRQMTIADEDALSGQHVPAAYGLVDRCAEHRVLTEHHGSDATIMAAQHVKSLTLVAVYRPQADSVVLAAGRQHAQIVADRHALNATAMFVDHLQQHRLNGLFAYYYAHIFFVVVVSC